MFNPSLTRNSQNRKTEISYYLTDPSITTTLIVSSRKSIRNDNDVSRCKMPGYVDGLWPLARFARSTFFIHMHILPRAILTYKVLFWWKSTMLYSSTLVWIYLKCPAFLANMILKKPENMNFSPKYLHICMSTYLSNHKIPILF